MNNEIFPPPTESIINLKSKMYNDIAINASDLLKNLTDK